MRKLFCLLISLLFSSAYAQEVDRHNMNVVVVRKPEGTKLWDSTYKSKKYVKQLVYEEESYAIKLNPQRAFPPLPVTFFRLSKQK